ncbi:hypothetical protein COK13_19585 [Bacillus cereus]|nr:hypothetical protein CON49_25260 [Bacillus cereus]RFB58529.1 hypothetical protein DZB82_27420 [Bacillus sp. dmp5]PFI64530.1 hypothetical protein COI82_25355 [Bacillus cereus]PFL30287.1 hypothetical protein COJ16_26480 [Bacillus cereus]PFO50048.1 hypothetical protein COJ74_28290 [Bacillus cereus]
MQIFVMGAFPILNLMGMWLNPNNYESIKMSKFYRFLVPESQKGPMLGASDPRLFFIGYLPTS